MSRTTPATVALTELGVPFTLHAYAYDSGAAKVGLQAAEALGEPPARVLKTLIAQVDGQPVCVVVPSDRELSMKKVAAAFRGKSAAMVPVPDAERLTGYKVGGVSPFGQKRRLPTAVEQDALSEPYVYVNGGQRGLQIRLAPQALVEASGAITAAVCA
jgi:Cys-tRNA(Pro)/Cys-tRNA(Cys) deacylase